MAIAPVVYSPIYEIPSAARQPSQDPLGADRRGRSHRSSVGSANRLQAGAYISNFLNRKRGLSLEGMDKVLVVQHLSVLDLLDPGEVNKRASIMPPSDGEFDNVLLTDGAVAATQPSIA